MLLNAPESDAEQLPPLSWRTLPWLRIVTLWLFWRLGLELFGYVASAWFLPQDLQQSGSPATWSHLLLGCWGNWDGKWYEAIARLGYGGAFARLHNPVVFTFFPLYPGLALLVSLVSGVSSLAALLLVSNLSSLLCCVVLYRLARLDTDALGAERAVTFLLAYPFAFFLGAAYTESLYLLFTLLTFWEARQGRWLQCGLFGALTCLTRHVGIVMVPALALELWLQKRRFTREFLYLLLVPCGMLIYFSYLGLRFGDFWMFFKAQAACVPPRHLSWKVWQPFSSQAGNLLHDPFGPAFVLPWFEVASLALALVSGILCFKRVRPSYGLYTVLAILPPLTAGLTQGATRYVAVLFPIFLLLAGRGPERAGQRGWLLISIMLLAFFALLFSRFFFVA